MEKTKSMKCAIIECDKKLTPNQVFVGYKAHNVDHGSYLNTILANLRSALIWHEGEEMPTAERRIYSIVKAKHYGKYLA